jgi:peroxiredoxin
MVQIGDAAPEFALRNQNNQEVTLAQFKGEKNVLLVFYPLAFTGVCSGELQALRDERATFQNDNVQLLTVSVDSPFAHRVWDDQEGFGFPLLADFWPHGSTAQAYGIFDDTKGIARRGTFLLDKDGIIQWRVENDITTPRDTAAYREALAALTT